MKTVCTGMALVLLAGVVGCMEGDHADNNYVTYKLEEHRYCLPETQNIFQYGVTTGIFSIPGADIGSGPPSFTLYFSGAELQAAVPAYVAVVGSRDARANARVSRPGADYVQHYLRRDIYRDDFTLSGENTFVNYDEKLGLYRVSQLPYEQDILWIAFKHKPEAGREVSDYMPDYVLGSCVRFSGWPSRCTAAVGIDDYLIEIDAAEVNIHLQQPLAEYVVAKLTQWEQRCRE